MFDLMQTYDIDLISDKEKMAFDLDLSSDKEQKKTYDRGFSAGIHGHILCFKYSVHLTLMGCMAWLLFLTTDHLILQFSQKGETKKKKKKERNQNKKVKFALDSKSFVLIFYLIVW